VKRANRLRKGAEFDQVYAKGTVLNGPLFVLRYRANEIGVPRWGFAVGKRLSKRAVERNRTKRRLRESADALELSLGVDIILTAKQPAMDAKQRELAAALLERASRIDTAAGSAP
jgi:ribonuclease P protein component